MILFGFFLALSALLLQATYPGAPAVLAFAPFLILACMRCPLQKTLWMAAGCGALLDLLSDDPMGVHALNYVAVVALLYRYRRQFSHDEPLHLSLYTALFSSLSTVLQLFLLFLFDRRVPFEGKWILFDFVGMPVIDGLYAFAWFAAPLSLFEILRRKWVVYWLKKRNPSPT